MKAIYSNGNKSLIQNRNMNGIDLSATYLPIHWERLLGRSNGDADQQMSFKVIVVPPKSPGESQKNIMPVTDVDTLFALIVQQDTIAPLFAQQIANGNPSSVEYLVTFKRQGFDKVTALQLVFKDWLYTHSRMAFPFEVNQIKNIDSLSSRL